MTRLKQNWISLALIFVAIFVVGIFLPTDFSLAHQSGCHRWHSCPSDSGSYICGDAGHPCQYPTYPASGGVIYPPSGYYKDCYDCAIKKVPANATVSGYTLSCNWGYYKSGSSCIKLVVPVNATISSAGHSWNCNSGYKEVDNSCIKIIPDMSGNIQAKIKENQIAYYKNPHLFRERFIENLTNEFGLQYSGVISRLTYTLLPDVKKPVTTTATTEDNSGSTNNSGCNKNYSGCLLIGKGDYDCRGGSGDGPNYTGRVRVIGYDEYGLDRDGDGIGCE